MFFENLLFNKYNTSNLFENFLFYSNSLFNIEEINLIWFYLHIFFK